MFAAEFVDLSAGEDVCRGVSIGRRPDAARIATTRLNLVPLQRTPSPRITGRPGLQSPAEGQTPLGGLVGSTGQLTHRAGARAVEYGFIGGGELEIKGQAGGAHTRKTVKNDVLPRATDRGSETGFQSPHHDIDVLVPRGIEIGDSEQMLKKGLLSPLQMMEVARVVKNSQGVEFIEMDLGTIGVFGL